MIDTPAGKSTRQGDQRANRLAQALRENLKRRKAQARGRARPPVADGSGLVVQEAVSPVQAPAPVRQD